MPFPRLSDVKVPQATLVTIGREQQISADSHMTEPPDLWEKRLPPAELAMPVNMHINSGPGRMQFSPQQRSGLMPDGAAGHKWDCMQAVGNIIAAGVLERYPGLHLVVAEAGVGWIPFFAQEFDYYQVSFGPSNAGVGRQRDIPRPPSAYIYRQVYGAFIRDTVGCKLLPDYGLDTFMWSNDYPHSACIWPVATQFIAQDLGHLMPEGRAKVLCSNAARLYNDGQLPPPPDPAGEVKDLEAWNTVHWGE